MKRKFLKFTIYIFFIFILFFIINFVHFNFFKTTVVFYTSLFDLSISILISIIFIDKFLNQYSKFEKLLTILISIFMIYSYIITVPAVIDRSLSLYILEKIHINNGVRLNSIEDLVKNEYISDMNVINVRIVEQLNSSTIKIEDDCVILTNKGRLINSFTKFYKKNFLPKNNQIKIESNLQYSCD